MHGTSLESKFSGEKSIALFNRVLGQFLAKSTNAALIYLPASSTLGGRSYE